MKTEELHEQWKKRKRQSETAKDFSAKVLNRIYQYERAKSKAWFSSMRLTAIISAHPLAKVAIIVSGAVTGLVRLTLVIVAILSGGTVNG